MSNRRAPRTVFVRKYGICNFLWDLLWLCLTGGLWIIWILIREIRYATAR